MNPIKIKTAYRRRYPIKRKGFAMIQRCAAEVAAWRTGKQRRRPSDATFYLAATLRLVEGDLMGDAAMARAAQAEIDALPPVPREDRA